MNQCEELFIQSNYIAESIYPYPTIAARNIWKTGEENTLTTTYVTPTMTKITTHRILFYFYLRADADSELFFKRGNCVFRMISTVAQKYFDA